VKLPGTAERALLAQLVLSPGRTIPATMLVDRLWRMTHRPLSVGRQSKSAGSQAAERSST
jgi:hypothetical protein